MYKVFLGSSSSDGIDRHVEHGGCRRDRRVRERSRSSLVGAADLPDTEEKEKAKDGPSDHGSGRGKNPVTEDTFLGDDLGLLRHRLEFLDQDVGVESSRDLAPESVDSLQHDFAFGLLKELRKRPGPFQPFVQDLDLLAVIGRDDVVHGPDVAAGVEPDCLPR